MRYFTFMVLSLLCMGVGLVILASYDHKRWSWKALYDGFVPIVLVMMGIIGLIHSITEMVGYE